MSQKHVNLLMEAVSLNTDDKYLCNRIGYICGMYLVRDLHSEIYSEEDYQALTQAIQKNINENLVDELSVEDSDEHTFESTTFYEQGMTREQWAKDVLAPLALALEEE
jgi:hypothetical protein